MAGHAPSRLPDAPRLWITDARNARFATEGRFHEQTVAISSDGARHAVVRMDSLFEPADTFFFPDYDSEQFVHTSERGSIGASVPFAPSQQEQWDPRGFLWVAVNDEYAITQFTMEGDTLMVIRKSPGEPIPVTSEEREEAVENLEWFTRQGGRVDPGRIPSEKPVFTSFTTPAATRLAGRPVSSLRRPTVAGSILRAAKTALLEAALRDERG